MVWYDPLVRVGTNWKIGVDVLQVVHVYIHAKLIDLASVKANKHGFVVVHVVLTVIVQRIVQNAYSMGYDLTD